MIPFDIACNYISQRPTVIYGLKYAPSLQPHVDDNQDTPAWGWPTGPEISDCNLLVVGQVLSRLGQNCKNIMEIGVDRNGEKSISRVLLSLRPDGCKYLGVDLDDKSYMNDTSNNIWTIQSNSHDQHKIRKKIDSIGMEKIDLLMIDGWHSVNTCINDWCYADLLSENGCIILHDTNAHPGCICLFHAVDENVFEKTRHCTDMNDMGISTFWHKSKNA
jgi:hypothetical protein